MTRKVSGGPVRLEQCRGHLRWRDDATYYDARMEAYSSYERVNG